MKPIFNSLSIWFGLIMIVVVTSGAIAFAFTDFMNDRLYGTKRIIFIFILFAYAVYRGFRMYQAIKYRKDGE